MLHILSNKININALAPQKIKRIFFRITLRRLFTHQFAIFFNYIQIRIDETAMQINSNSFLTDIKESAKSSTCFLFLLASRLNTATIMIMLGILILTEKWCNKLLILWNEYQTVIVPFIGNRNPGSTLFEQ